MYSFKNDYAEGAHPNILQKLIDSNLEQQDGYGADAYATAAKTILQERMANPKAKIFFVSGGTQTNLLVIASLLRPHEAVISAQTGHIYANETGAIEATGHKVIPVESTDGKVKAADIDAVLQAYTLRPHVVKPKMVYISNSTEIGSIYSKSELEALYQTCQAAGLYLFMDGARLGHALTAASNDLSLADVARLTDVFYIGGTKNGALLGEAVVFNHAGVGNEFDYILKQRGALLAKGRILSIQFLELFRENLYFDLAKHANQMAMRIAEAMLAEGYTFLTPPVSNQLFPILPKKHIAQLLEKFAFYEWKAIDEQHSAIRLITSWATQESLVDTFIDVLKGLKD